MYYLARHISSGDAQQARARARQRESQFYFLPQGRSFAKSELFLGSFARAPPPIPDSRCEGATIGIDFVTPLRHEIWINDLGHECKTAATAKTNLNAARVLGRARATTCVLVVRMEGHS